MQNDLSARDKQVIWHPYTPQMYAPPPIAIVKGEGVHIIDTSGKKYIDAISSWWVTIHGHAHPYIAEMIYHQALQLEQVIFAGFTHEPAVRLAERLLPILPGTFAKVFYSDNGSTAVEVAIKMAVQFWWNRGTTTRTRILAFENSYHGDTFGAMSVSARSVFSSAFEPLLFGVDFIAIPTADNFERNKSIIDKVAEKLACFIYEPLLQGAGGMNMYDAEPLDRLLSYIRSLGIICIADEVLTGFGRTGRLFAGSYVENKADIICLSKGLTGGTMALGVTACSNMIYEAYLTTDRYKTFFHGHSFTANPIACTAALASLDLLERPECVTQLGKITALQASFCEEIRNHDGLRERVINCRHLGTIMAFDLSTDVPGYLNSSGATIAAQAMEQGVFIRPLGNTIYLMPPYSITSEQLRDVHQILLNTLLSEFGSGSVSL